MIKRISSADKKNIIIICLCIIVLLMVTGFSSFAQIIATDRNLLKGPSENERWSVVYSSAKIISEDGGKITGFTFNPRIISLATDINKPGGKVALEITIKNNGDLDARVDKITMTPYFMSNDDRLLKTLDGLSVGDVIKSGQSVNVVYTIKHNPEVELYNRDILTSKLTIDYVQAK